MATHNYLFRNDFLNFKIQLHQIAKDRMLDISTVQKYFTIPIRKKRLLKKF